MWRFKAVFFKRNRCIEMSDIIHSAYKTFFSVMILHHYFLDEGKTVFLFDKTKKQPELKNYDVRQFLTIIPTVETQEALKKAGAVYRVTTMGFWVAVPDGKSIKTGLEFTLVPTDPFFINYTTLTLKGYKTESYQYKEDEELKSFRVRNNVFVLTNKDRNDHFLSEKIPAQTENNFSVEEFFKAEGKLFQAIRDGAGAEFREEIKTPTEPMNAVLPVFVNQNDIPTREIEFLESENSPDGNAVLKTKKKNIRGVVLTDTMPDEVVALIKIDPATAHFSDPNLPPTFEVHFKSRATYWRYFDTKQSQYKAENPDYWSPFTLKGGHPDRQKATPDRLKIEKDDTGKISRLISEINP